MIEAKKTGIADGAVEEGSGSAVPGAGDLFAKTVKLVSEGIAHSAKEAGKDAAANLESVSQIVQTSLREAVGAGSNLVLGAKAIVVGVLRGTGEKEEAALKLLSHTARAVIRCTAQLGGDLAASVKGLVLGAIAGAKDANVDRARMASAGAQGALEGADEAGSVAADRVRQVLKETIGGVKVVLPDPIRR